MFALFLSWDLEYSGLMTNFGLVPFIPWGTSGRVRRSKNIHNEKASTVHETLEVEVKDAVTINKIDAVDCLIKILLATSNRV